MTGVTLRDIVTKKDVGAIRTMVERSGVFSLEEIEVAEELAQDCHTNGRKSHYHFFLAEKEGALLGYSCFGRIPLTAERYDLYWIVVDNKAQHQGTATLLIHATETAIHALGGKALYAETSSRDVYVPAQKFYLKQGFTEAARLKAYYADHDDKVIYSKKI